MATWSATVGGTTVDALVGVDLEGADSEKIGKATITCGNTSTNRGFESGDTAQIDKNGSEEFGGFVIGKPTLGDNNEFLEIEVGDRRYELQKHDVSRVFYDMDTGAIIRAAVNKTIEPLSPQLVHVGESISDWTSDAPVFQQTGFQDGQYREYGSNMIGLGWRAGVSGEYHATYTAVPSGAIPGDGQISRLATRFLVNNRGGQFKVEVGLKDNAGNLYVWQPDRLRSGFNTYEFRAEKAATEGDFITDADLSNGELRYVFKIQGSLGEPRAAIIDHAETTPFLLDARNPNITTNNVLDSGRSITRRFDSNVFDILKQLGVEDNATSYIDQSDDLHYEPSGQTTSGKTIDYASTPVVDASFDTDYDDIVNEVTVQYAEGSVTVSADSSIEFYGISSRSEPLIKPNIQTEGEALAHGKGYLEDNAWSDTPMEFTIADTTFGDVRVGEEISVTWDPPDGVNVVGQFVVSSVSSGEDGYPTIGVTGRV